MPGLTRTRAIVAAAVATAAALAIALLAQAAPGDPTHGTLTTVSGMPIDVTYTKADRTLTAFTRLRDGRRIPLADGVYALSNGGAIRVRGGRIVWDAFGVVDKLNRGVPVNQPGDNGG